MKTNELKEKFNKANDKVQKTIKTIERHEKRIEKILTIIRSHGWNENDAWCMINTDQHNDAYWTICDFNNAQDDLKNSKKKLKEAERIAQDWKIKLDDQVKNERIIDLELPKIFKLCQIELTEEWTSSDIATRDTMMEFKKNSTYEIFTNRYPRSTFERLNRTDEDFRKENMETAEHFILDLYYRVKDITGEVTSWAGIHYSGKALNGLVKGKNANVIVETIMAGGYNIQRLHYRVLVKEVK